MYFKGAYLRITEPETTNGMLPKIVNGRQVTKETFLPLTAKKAMERKAARLKRNGFAHLAPVIEVVGEEDYEQLTNKRKR